MASLSFNAETFPLAPQETVLDCLLRNGQAVPYSCRSGACQACLVRAVDCEPTARSNQWLKPSLRAKGYALACQWLPEADVRAELPDMEGLAVQACISTLDRLNPTVCRLRLKPTDPATMFAYRPGQYLTLINGAGTARSYSIANDYERDGHVELHVGATRHGLFTRWLFGEARVGDTVHMRGPAGDCFYDARDLDPATAPLLLAGTGTGLAPLLGIVNDALRLGHGGPVHLFHGGGSMDRLYCIDSLQALARKHTNFRYYPCVQAGGGADVFAGSVEEVIDAHLDGMSPGRLHAWLCGAPAFVQALRKRLFLRGVRSSHILCDAFTERSVQQA